MGQAPLFRAAQLSLAIVAGAWALSATANEESQRLIEEATQAMRATPPRSLEAIERARAATAADPLDARAWFVRGAYALTAFLPGEALEAIDRAAALDPKLPNFQFLRGRALHELGRHVAALEAFDREPNKEGNPAFWFHRGLANKDAGRHAEALADFERSDKVYPQGRASTQLHRGDIYAAQGRAEEAGKAYDLVVTLDPKSPVAGTAQERLKILRRPVELAPPKRLFVRAFAGAERDTNIASLDPLVAAPLQLRQKADWRLVTDVNLRYFALQTPESYAGVTGDARGSFHRRNTDYDDMLLGGSVFGGRAFGLTRLGGELRFDRSWIDYGGYSKATNATVFAAHSFNASNESVLAYRRRWQHFDAVQADPLRDRDGETDYVSLNHVIRLYAAGSSFLEIEPAVRYGRERTSGGYFDNREWTGFLTLRGQFQRFTYPTFVEAGLIYGEQDYTNGAAQLGVNVTDIRGDETFSQTLRLVQPLTRTLGIETAYRHTRNSSNVQGFSYSTHVFRVGVVFWF